MIPPAFSLCRLPLFSLPHSLCFSLSLSQELGNLIEEPFSILPLEAMGDGIESSIYEALERDCGLELGKVQTAPYGIWPIFRILHIHTHQTLFPPGTSLVRIQKWKSHCSHRVCVFDAGLRDGRLPLSLEQAQLVCALRLGGRIIGSSERGAGDRRLQSSPVRRFRTETLRVKLHQLLSVHGLYQGLCSCVCVYRDA